MKIVKYFEESGLRIKDISKTTENKAKKIQEVDFMLCMLSMLLRKLGAGLLGNM